MGEYPGWDADLETAHYQRGTAATIREHARQRKSRCVYGYKFVNTDTRKRCTPAKKRRK